MSFCFVFSVNRDGGLREYPGAFLCLQFVAATTMTKTNGDKMLSQKEFVEGCYNWYREADLQPGNPEDGDWDEAHYPIPNCKGGTETILLLRGHHAIQGVIQSEEMQHMCIFNWEKKYLSGEYLELFYKWKSEGMKVAHARHSHEEKILIAEKKRKTHSELPEEVKILRAEKVRAKTVAYLDRMTEAERILRDEKLRVSAITRWEGVTEEERILRAEKLRAYHAHLTEEEKILRSKKLSEGVNRYWARRRERQAQELLARWKEGVVRECIL